MFFFVWIYVICESFIYSALHVLKSQKGSKPLQSQTTNLFTERSTSDFLPAGGGKTAINFPSQFQKELTFELYKQ